MNTHKIIAITILFTLAFTMPLKSQSVYEFGIKFANDTTATMVGGDGAIYITSDGGYSWNQQESNTTNTLYCTDITYKIYSLDSPQRIPIGITVGENGLILRTINGGYIWNTLESGTYNHLRGVHSNINTQTVVICGDNGTIMYSNDAGETFVFDSSQTNANLYSVAYSPEIVQVNRLDASKVLAVGDAGTILMSGDYGITWTPILTNISDNLRSVSWADCYTVTIVGENGAIYTSTDRGYTWNQSKDYFACNFYGVKYVDASTAIAVGDNGTIIRSTNNGMQWTRVESYTQNSIMSVNFANTTKGIAVGEESTTLYTEDGGQTWSSQNTFGKGSISRDMNKKNFKLGQNYPNPFNPSTTINYNLPVDSRVSLKVYDMVGKQVAELVNAFQIKGSHSVNFNARNLTSGVYFYKINAGEYNEVKKMILVK